MNDQYKILLVEDEPIVVDSASRILGAEGLQIDHVYDANKAIEKLNKINYELIISDLMLPSISGIELIEKVRRVNSKIPIIIITGYANLENAIKSFKMGAFDFLPKPFDFEELIAVVFRALNYSDLIRPVGPGGKKHLRFIRSQIKRKDEEKYYFLGEHSWAKMEKNGVVSIGVAETFPNTMGELFRLEMPHLKTEVWQGNLCVRIFAKNNLSHIVWAPLSGQVIEINNEVEEKVDLINTDPFGKGWLFKIVPTNFANEVENLVLLK